MGISTTLREQFRFSGALRRRKGTLAIVFIAVFVLLSSPQWYRAYVHTQAGLYCQRINPELAADPRFHKVSAWKTLKYMRYALSFSGSVRSQRDLESLEAFISGTKPPGEYSIGVWIAPDEP